MKKLLCLILAAILLTFTACNGNIKKVSGKIFEKEPRLEVLSEGSALDNNEISFYNLNDELITTLKADPNNLYLVENGVVFIRNMGKTPYEIEAEICYYDFEKKETISLLKFEKTFSYSLGSPIYDAVYKDGHFYTLIRENNPETKGIGKITEYTVSLYDFDLKNNKISYRPLFKNNGSNPTMALYNENFYIASDNNFIVLDKSLKDVSADFSEYSENYLYIKHLFATEENLFVLKYQDKKVSIDTINKENKITDSKDITAVYEKIANKAEIELYVYNGTERNFAFNDNLLVFGNCVFKNGEEIISARTENDISNSGKYIFAYDNISENDVFKENKIYALNLENGIVKETSISFDDKAYIFHLSAYNDKALAVINHEKVYLIDIDELS